MLKSINEALASKLEPLNDTVEKLQGEFFDPQKTNKKLSLVD